MKNDVFGNIQEIHSYILVVRKAMIETTDVIIFISISIEFYSYLHSFSYCSFRTG